MATGSGVAMGWAWWAKSGGPRVQTKFLFNFTVAVKIRTSGYQTIECFIATLPNYVYILVLQSYHLL